MPDSTLETIVRLKEVEQLSWAEIAEAVGLNKNTAKKRYQRYQQSTDAPVVTNPDIEPVIEGVFPEDYEPDQKYIDALWKQVKTRQERTFKQIKRQKWAQRVMIPAPSALALTSDLHLGGSGIDYKAAHSDAVLIRDIDRMFGSFHGDGINNWIIGKLANLQHGEVVSYDDEWLLFFDWLNILGDKMLFCVAGNHDNWTRKVAHWDRLRDALKNVKTLYHPQEVRFDLKTGRITRRIKARHKWRGSSIFNVTHGIEVGWERGGYDFDIGIGGHYHTGTFDRPFTRHGRDLHAMMTGTYKLFDDFGDEIGLAAPAWRGCGAMVFDEDGEMVFFRNLEKAADYLKFLCKKAKV